MGGGGGFFGGGGGDGFIRRDLKVLFFFHREKIFVPRRSVEMRLAAFPAAAIDHNPRRDGRPPSPSLRTRPGEQSPAVSCASATSEPDTQVFTFPIPFRGTVHACVCNPPPAHPALLRAAS